MTQPQSNSPTSRNTLSGYVRVSGGALHMTTTCKDGIHQYILPASEFTRMVAQNKRGHGVDRNLLLQGIEENSIKLIPTKTRIIIDDEASDEIFWMPRNEFVDLYTWEKQIGFLFGDNPIQFTPEMENEYMRVI